MKPTKPDASSESWVGGHWLPSHRADPRALALYLRHYSAEKNRAWRGKRSLNFVGPGEPMVLLTQECDALFVWLRNSVERYDKQTGISCTVFRNESPVLSSVLVREADHLAWQRWPGERHFTYVDAGKVRRKRDPGRCFIKAGWRRCGTSKGGLVILECLSEWMQDDATTEVAA